MNQPSMATLSSGKITLRDARRGTTRDVELEPFEMAVHPLRDRSTGRPLTPLTWFETINLCNELSNAEELQPAYTRAGDGRSVTWNTSADGYRVESLIVV